MHMGKTSGPATKRPMLNADATSQGATKDCGATSSNGLVMGCYVHGLFAADAYRAAFLNRIRAGDYGRTAHDALVETTLDSLAAHLESHLDVDALLAIARA